MSINESPSILKVATAFSGGLAAPEFALKYEDIPHEVVFACEWDKYARKQYLEFHGLPGTFYNDVQTLRAFNYKHKIDLFVWGSPCQDLSLAGKRKGFDGVKSSLFREGARIQKEMMPKNFIFENVVGLLSSNGGADYKEVQKTFREQGYHIATVRMNTKAFGVPQNRDRIFIIGFLDVNEYHSFKVPQPFKLEKKLKDVLEDEVDKKYFLSKKMVQGFIKNSNDPDKRITIQAFHNKEDDYSNCITARYFKCGTTDPYIKDNQLNPSYKSQANTIHDINKISPTICAGTKGYSHGYIKLEQVGNIDQKGHNSLWGRVYSPEGIAPNLNANGGGAGAKTGLYQIKSNTAAGYELAKDGDCINYNHINSTTRRGRVGKGVAQTLDTQCNQGVIEKSNIRRLTPTECFRLQGVKDEDINLVVSDTQAYKIAGNAISVNVMQELIRALYKNQVKEKVSLFDFI
jgi:DNA (cytosine-5)-methyltransferase 1